MMFFFKMFFDCARFFCEDAINIMNSKGSINKIDIKNSYFDGLDIDFSSISIENVIIENLITIVLICLLETMTLKRLKLIRVEIKVFR